MYFYAQPNVEIEFRRQRGEGERDETIKIAAPTQKSGGKGLSAYHIV